MLKKLNISYKKAKKVDPKKSEEKIQEWKKDISTYPKLNLKSLETMALASLIQD